MTETEIKKLIARELTAYKRDERAKTAKLIDTVIIEAFKKLAETDDWDPTQISNSIYSALSSYKNGS